MLVPTCTLVYAWKVVGSKDKVLGCVHARHSDSVASRLEVMWEGYCVTDDVWYFAFNFSKIRE